MSFSSFSDLRLALDVLAEQRVHEEGEVEGGGREVAGEEQRVHRLAHLLDLAVARGGILRPASGAGCPRWAWAARRRRSWGSAAWPWRRASRDRPRRPAWSSGSPVSVSNRMRAHREHVRARVAGPSVRLLGRQVQRSLLGQRARLAQPAGPVPEPAQPHLALVGDQHAAGRHQPVEVAAARLVLAAVRVLERRADLAGDEQRVVHREREALLAAAVEDRRAGSCPPGTRRRCSRPCRPCRCRRS